MQSGRFIIFCGIRVYGTANYNQASPQGRAKTIAVSNNGTPYIVNEEGQIYEGDVNGERWNLLPSNDGYTVDIDFNSEDTLYKITRDNEFNQKVHLLNGNT